MLPPTIAVLDSGLDSDLHKKLQGNIVAGYEYSWDLNKIVETSSFPDKNGHGTQCISLIHSLAKDAQIIVVKILNDDGATSGHILALALEFLLKLYVQVVHMSLSVTHEDDSSQRISTCCKRLSDQGAILVCSILNGADDSFPACLPSVLAVQGAVFKQETDLDIVDTIIKDLKEYNKSLVLEDPALKREIEDYLKKLKNNEQQKQDRKEAKEKGLDYV